jgi:hypothetical protein
MGNRLSAFYLPGFPPDAPAMLEKPLDLPPDNG